MVLAFAALGLLEPEFTRQTSVSWSPDGHWVAYQGGSALWRVPARGGEPEQLTQCPAIGPYVWSDEGAEVFFERDNDYWAVSVSDGSERQLTTFEGKEGRMRYVAEAISTDGQSLYFLWMTSIGDIWVADLAWDDQTQP